MRPRSWLTFLNMEKESSLGVGKNSVGSNLVYIVQLRFSVRNSKWSILSQCDLLAKKANVKPRSLGRVNKL